MCGKYFLVIEASVICINDLLPLLEHFEALLHDHRVTLEQLIMPGDRYLYAYSQEACIATQDTSKQHICGQATKKIAGA